MSDPRLLSAEQLADMREHPYAGYPAAIVLAHIDAQAERIAGIERGIRLRNNRIGELTREVSRLEEAARESALLDLLKGDTAARDLWRKRARAWKALAKRLTRKRALLSKRDANMFAELASLKNRCWRLLQQSVGACRDRDRHRDALRDAIQCCIRCGLSRRALQDNRDGCYDTGPCEFGEGPCWYTERQRKADELISCLRAEALRVLACPDVGSGVALAKLVLGEAP
jgi:hypothetical protein